MKATTRLMIEAAGQDRKPHRGLRRLVIYEKPRKHKENRGFKDFWTCRSTSEFRG